MIYIDQSDKLKHAMDKLKDKPYFRDTVSKFGEQGMFSGKDILSELATESFQIEGKDRVKLELKIDTTSLGKNRDQAIMASVLAKAIEQCSTKSINHSIQSCYSAPPQIEATYRQLKPSVGQQDAMKSCSGMEVDGKPFSWKDAKLKGFIMSVSMTKDLQGFDSKIIDRQKQQLSKQLSKNISYHLDNVLNDISIDRARKIEPESPEYSVGVS